jgi:hypothetical protein
VDVKGKRVGLGGTRCASVAPLGGFVATTAPGGVRWLFSRPWWPNTYANRIRTCAESLGGRRGAAEIRQGAPETEDRPPATVPRQPSDTPSDPAPRPQGPGWARRANSARSVGPSVRFVTIRTLSERDRSHSGAAAGLEPREQALLARERRAGRRLDLDLGQLTRPPNAAEVDRLVVAGATAQLRGIGA